MSTTAQQKNEFRGVWLTNVDSRVLATDDNIVEAMNFLASIGINVVFPVVYNKGYTLYPSAVMDSLFGQKVIPDVSFQNRDFLERTIIEAHRNGIEVIPWFEFGFSSSYSLNGGHIIQKFPHWALKNSQGNLVVKNGFDWLSGIHPEVQDYILDLILEVIENYDVDGIQGDDRLPAMPVEGGYEEYTVELYKSEHDGSSPPTHFSNSAWMKWRADKLTDYFLKVKDSVKSRGDYLIISSSPTPYYWGYNQYLQDSKAWSQQSIAENLIPQLYQYNINDFNYALNSTWNDVGQYSPNNFYAGILMNIGTGANEYVISENLLTSKLNAVRNKSVKGECFFFYEGLRKNNNQLGEFLASEFYSEAAALPYRDGKVFRPKAKIVNEDSVSVNLIGEWQEYSMKGFEGKILRTNESNSYTSIEYKFDISDEAFYDVYTFRTPNTPWTKAANYTIYHKEDSTNVMVDQSDLSLKGWHKLGTAFLTPGYKTVVKLDNKWLEDGKFLVADAVMLMINRKLSPNVVVSVKENKTGSKSPDNFFLSQNYPNPFNPSTKIRFSVADRLKQSSSEIGHAILRIYDVLGREIGTLLNEPLKTGEYEIIFNASGLPSGVYFYNFKYGNFSQTRKMLLIR